jgi:hypothetical protein
MSRAVRRDAGQRPAWLDYTSPTTQTPTSRETRHRRATLCQLGLPGCRVLADTRVYRDDEHGTLRACSHCADAYRAADDEWGR